ncbi:hypothetical protein BVRB_8g181450 [Beta vulgaris subsp. vulgaris]|nr:hypothetical protein BVRB_8g181450 [Beta vulgaris subsp. vulgaris]
MHEQASSSSFWEPWQRATTSSTSVATTTATTTPSSFATPSITDTANKGEVAPRAGCKAVVRDQDAFRTAMFLSCWTCS